MGATLHIFLKEAREMLRDKRVRSGAFVTPILMMFMLIFIFGFITDTLRKPQNIKVSVVGSGPLVEALREAKMQVASETNLEQALQKVRDGKIRVVLEVPDLKPKSGEQIVIRAHFDPKDDKAKINVSQLGAVFSKLNQATLETLVVSKGLTKEAAEPIKFEEMPVKVGEEGASELIISLLPYLIVLYAFYGGMGSVGDLVAGEKEKMTLETLLIAPVSRVEVALGKFFALAMLCLASSLSAALGLLLAGLFKLKMLEVLFPNGSGVSTKAFLITLIALIPAVILFAALMLAVSTKAKNMREAQTQLTLLSLVVLLPAMFSQFIGLTDWAKAAWVNAVPVLNTATAIRAAMQGKPDLGGLAVGVVVNAVLGVIAILWAIKLFKREEVLVRV